MSTLTPRLQLKRWDGSDPYKRADFNDNWNKIDAAPGAHICTSSSRPTWGAAQAGREIIETDTRRKVMWTGTAWAPILDAPAGWCLGQHTNQVLAKGASATYTLGTLRVSRPGTLLIDLSANLATLDTTQQSASLTVYVNDQSSGHYSYMQWTGSNNNTAWQSYATTVSKGTKAVVPNTDYKIQARVSCGTLSTLSLTVYRLLANVVLASQESV